MVASADPKPYEPIPYGESYPEKSVKIRNNTNITLYLGQLPSDWEHVNFIIEDDITHAEYDKSIRPLTDDNYDPGLRPGDFIVVTFSKPTKLEP